MLIVLGRAACPAKKSVGCSGRTSGGGRRLYTESVRRFMMLWGAFGGSMFALVVATFGCTSWLDGKGVWHGVFDCVRSWWWLGVGTGLVFAAGVTACEGLERRLAPGGRLLLRGALWAVYVLWIVYRCVRR